jgi:hypothetical protein
MTNTMIEFLKHFIGFCGEPHPSLITLIFGTPIISYLYYNYKNKRNK